MQYFKKLLSYGLFFSFLWQPLSSWADMPQTFIGMSPTEFSEGFNHAAQIYRLKPRMPIWPAREGKFNARITPHVTISATGANQGLFIERIEVRCQRPDQCAEVIWCATFSADPEMSPAEISVFQDYINQSMQGELKDAVFILAGLTYSLKADTKQKSIIFTIEPEKD